MGKLGLIRLIGLIRVIAIKGYVFDREKILYWAN